MINKKTVQQAAKAARISLTPSESRELEKDLRAITEAFSVLEKVKTRHLEPSYQPIEIKNAVRPDIPENSLSRKKAMQNTKNKEKGYFTGPRSF